MRKSDRMHWASGLLVAAVLIPGISGQGEAARPGKKPPASAVQQAKPGGELAAGDTVPTRVQLRDLTSKVVDLGLLCGPLALRYNPGRPKALLVDFYMTSCVPCNAALPALGQIVEQYRSRGLRALLISLDGTEHAAGGQGVSGAALREKLSPARLQDGEVVRDPGRVLAEDFGLVKQETGKGSTVSVPRTFLVDDQCKVRGVYTDLVDNRPAAEKLLDELVGAAAAAGRGADGVEPPAAAGQTGPAPP